MRKIYPLLFNKFAIFVLYGLLSIALIALAQQEKQNEEEKDTLGDGMGKNDCNIQPLNPVSRENKQVTIGYVQPFSQPINYEVIPWDEYDYINVIAYPSNNEGEQYNIYRPDDDGKLKPLNDLVNFKNSKYSDTKILLSLRNYDIGKWPKNGGEDYDTMISETRETIEVYGLDGIDIEYPGTRGKLCLNGQWGNDDDGRFFGFLSRLRIQMNQMGGDKKLMLTVGIDTVNGINSNLNNFNFNNTIDFLNIETYHYSLYNNLNAKSSNSISSYPNNPYDVYEDAFTKWAGLINNNKKIIMSVDFGNTIQVVDTNGGDISKTQTFMFSSYIQFDVENLITNNEIPKIPITPIKDYCGSGNSNLYKCPWKVFTEFFRSCADATNFSNREGWKRGFGETSKTPWLYKNYNPLGPNSFIYLSYEDIFSLRNKLEFVIGKSIGGMSISDVSYDDEENTLLEYMQVIRGEKPNFKTGSNTNSTTPNKEGEEKGKKSKSKVGAIVGPIVGIFAAAAFIGAFVYYLKKRPKSKDEDFNSKVPIQTHTNFKNELPSEPTSRLVPQTTVIPAASGHVTAMFDFVGREETDLSFKKGDIIEVLEKGDGPNDWWVGRVNGNVGEFPGNYVKET